MDSPLEIERMEDRNRSHGQNQEELHLVLDPPAVQVRQRRRPHHPCLHADIDNHIEATVNGRKCHVLFDSGANISFTFWNTARKLGLITGQEPTTSIEIEMWDGPTTIEIVEVDSVHFDLGSGVVVVTPITVFPRLMEESYNNEVVMDVHQMRRGNMVQVFRPDGSDIFVKNPQALKRKQKKRQQSMEIKVLRLKSPNNDEEEEAMTMLVDTGAVGIHISEERRRLMMRSSENKRISEQVCIDTGDGCCLHHGPLGTVATNHNDFITGIELLGKYNASVDYANKTVTFQIGSQLRRANLYSHFSDLSISETRIASLCKNGLRSRC